MESNQPTIRIKHTVNSSNIDVKLDNRIILRNVPYKKLTNYINVSPGKHTITILSHGDIIGRSNIDVVADGEYTINFI